MSNKPTEEEVIGAMKHSMINVIFIHDFPTNRLEITVERAEYLAERVHRNLITFFNEEKWDENKNQSNLQL